MGWLIAGIVLSIIAMVVITGVITYFNNKKREDYEDKVKQYGSDKVKKPTFITKKYIFLGILPIFLAVFGCFASVNTGYTGVVTVFGSVKEQTLEAGMHFKAPWESVVQIDNRVQKQTVEMSAFSSDIQEVQIKYTINYQISKQNASEIYKTIGVEYYETVMQPRIEEDVKNAVKIYTAETLINSRDELAQKIFDSLKSDLDVYNIEVVSSSVENIDFSDAFTQAVENKQVASQQQQQAQIEQETKTLEQKAQAEREKITAEAQAEIAKIQAEADKAVAEIGADSAEYQGKKDNAIVMQKLIALNGYHFAEDNTTILDSDNNVVSADDLKTATQNLLLYYYIQQWSGELPDTYIGTSDFYEIFQSILAEQVNTENN
jgi:regulator of protease activity HflC (stomatin/prohibitin superfamily)